MKVFLDRGRLLCPHLSDLLGHVGLCRSEAPIGFGALATCVHLWILLLELCKLGRAVQNPGIGRSSHLVGLAFRIGCVRLTEVRHRDDRRIGAARCYRQIIFWYCAEEIEVGAIEERCGGDGVRRGQKRVLREGGRRCAKGECYKCAERHGVRSCRARSKCVLRASASFGREKGREFRWTSCGFRRIVGETSPSVSSGRAISADKAAIDRE